MHHTHPAPAAAARGLDDYRVAGFAGDSHDFLRVFRQRAVYARHHRHAGFFHGGFGAYLVAHQPYGFGPRSDEDEAALLHALGKIRILGQKTIAGVDRLGIGHFCRADDGRNVEVAQRRLRRPDAYRFVCQLHVLGFGVGLGMNYDSLDAHFAAGTLDSERDLAAIGYEDFSKH